MRNRIAITARRPVPLPDRILEDGWWLVRRAAPVERSGGLRLVTSRAEEGPRERDRGVSNAGPFRPEH
jgi:hypothetical protein